MIAVDPHKASNTAAVLDPVSKTLIETARFANSDEGYARLAGFARRWERRRWAVEGCHGTGRSLAQRLAADGERVLDVPAKLAARVRVYSRGHGRKTDKHDAVSIGLAALESAGVLPVARDDATVTLRLLCDRREELTAQRTQAVCRLHRLLAELTPGGMRRELTANKAQALLARIRPDGDVAQVRLRIARDHLADIRALDARLKTVAGQVAALVTESGTTLTSLYGIGPLSAGRILAEVGDIGRFARELEARGRGRATVTRRLFVDHRRVLQVRSRRRPARSLACCACPPSPAGLRVARPPPWTATNSAPSSSPPDSARPPSTPSSRCSPSTGCGYRRPPARTSSIWAWRAGTGR